MKTVEHPTTEVLQILELVKKNPGITIPELAEMTGRKQNYLYRILPGLEMSNHVVRETSVRWFAN